MGTRAGGVHISECSGISEAPGAPPLPPSTQNFEAKFSLNTELSVSQLAGHSSPPDSGFVGDGVAGMCRFIPAFLHGCCDLNSGLHDYSANALNC